MRFSLSGVEEALQNVASISRQVTVENLQEDALDALQPVVRDAQALAPVAEGDLRDSIEARIFEDGTIGVVIGNWKGHFFEFGTVKMRAQPMLGPAWYENEASTVRILEGRVSARIEGAV